ncbi:hypothetical protein A2567_00660 [Candidatus Azambacteria bacterium RIFOXYD1_FULL_42_11]|uniref:Uncharacterized protein n=4 Tax=Candidatus Azamiibacteriota TaxID=1752741 RepID=A0A0G0ZBM7_9BACT|nr:MAG: hypothetical protein UV07_C0011G0015 [Candidatus Azambacteria bacterium GW2011_GWB1_42_17]KKS46105.1 MAG: hypothetical protein UV10_C0008G0015 [Candidatus Azambacteria bacterium GW2011_GWA1_42_19]KKS75327.1 MAG: hypothetical protein UV48_C0014G0010 [Candidatus Azambacteria bacterium GW2011_GWA2_42_9]KKS88284.1 MAG: hypothetical protein UV62_C0010G0013 [Parcubacteria group bacterium GW2011_GWC1_43_11]OGD41889.1 MAG: hypothetical protein A2567_00660 [Candidatus Azambacteria bacterium RIFO
MKTEITHYCETCGNAFKGYLECWDHERSCEKYKIGDRVEVFYNGKGWKGTVILISMNPVDRKRFMVISTDERFDLSEDVDGIVYTGHEFGMWENTGNKNHIRRLVEQTGTDSKTQRCSVT